MPFGTSLESMEKELRSLLNVPTEVVEKTAEGKQTLSGSDHATVALVNTSLEPERIEARTFTTLPTEIVEKITELDQPLSDSGHPTTLPVNTSLEPERTEVEAQERKVRTLTTLPTEILEKIAEHLRVRDLKQLRRTCKQLEVQTIHYFTRRYCSRKYVVICPAQLHALAAQADNPKFGSKLKELIFETWTRPHKEPLQMHNLKYDLMDEKISKASGFLSAALNNLPCLRKVSMVSKPKTPGSLLTCHAIMILHGVQDRANTFDLEHLELPKTGNLLYWDHFMSGRLNGGYLHGFHEGPAPFRTIISLKLSLNGRCDGLSEPHYADHAVRFLHVFLNDLRALESLTLHLGDIRTPKEAANLGRVSGVILNMYWPNLRHVSLHGVAFMKKWYMKFFEKHNLREIELEGTVFGPRCFNKLAASLCSTGLTVERIRFKNLHELGAIGALMTPATPIVFTPGGRNSHLLVSEKGEIEEEMRKRFVYHNF
jgi:hypothetical protein